MKEIVDLSGVIESGTYGDTILFRGWRGSFRRQKLRILLILIKKVFFSSMIHMSTLTGSYVEAGSHIVKGCKEH